MVTPATCNDKVVASVQCALPQVDVYVGTLAPFASSLRFDACSSRSVVFEKHLRRYSPANGGAFVGCRRTVRDDVDGDSSESGQETQVRACSQMHEHLPCASIPCVDISSLNAVDKA